MAFCVKLSLIDIAMISSISCICLLMNYMAVLIDIFVLLICWSCFAMDSFCFKINLCSFLISSFSLFISSSFFHCFLSFRDLLLVLILK